MSCGDCVFCSVAKYGNMNKCYCKNLYSIVIHKEDKPCKYFQSCNAEDIEGGDVEDLS